MISLETVNNVARPSNEALECTINTDHTGRRRAASPPENEQSYHKLLKSAVILGVLDIQLKSF